MSIDIGKTAKFLGYTSLEEGQPAIFTEGDTVRIAGYDEAEDQYTIQSMSDETVVDVAFPEEVEELADEPVVEEKPKRTRGKTKAEAAPAAETAPAPTAAPAKGKGKAKTETAVAAPAEAPAPAAKPKTEIKVLSLISDLVQSPTIAMQSAKQLADRINEMSEQTEEAKFQLGGTLSYIKAENAYEEHGHASIEAYCEAELGLKARSCQYYIKIYDACTAAGITAKDIEGVGFTKLRHLTGVVTPENKRQLLTQAKKMTRDDFAEAMKANVGKTAPKDPQAATYTGFPKFKMFADQGKVLEQAVAAAKTSHDVDNFSEAMYYIAAEWLEAQGADVAVEDALAALNARYGLDLELPDEEEGSSDAAETTAA